MAINRSHLNKIRYRLYQKGLTDNQMAETEGCSLGAIRGWRNRRNLPFNRRSNFNIFDMPKWERQIVKDFLTDLLCLCHKVGKTPTASGIGIAMNVWREKRRLV